jgi:hypothetical protein
LALDNDIIIFRSSVSPIGRASSFNGGAVSPVFPIEEEKTNALGTPLLAAAAASDNFPQPHSDMIGA